MLLTLSFTLVTTRERELVGVGKGVGERDGIENVLEHRTREV